MNGLKKGFPFFGDVIKNGAWIFRGDEKKNKIHLSLAFRSFFTYRLSLSFSSSLHFYQRTVPLTSSFHNTIGPSEITSPLY